MMKRLLVLTVLSIWAASSLSCSHSLPRLSAEEWFDQVVDNMNRDSAIAFEGSRQVVVAGIYMAAQSAHKGSLQGKARAAADENPFGPNSDPVQMLNQLAQSEKTVTMQQTAEGLTLEVQLSPEEWKDMVLSQWRGRWESMSRDQEHKIQGYTQQLPADQAKQLENEVRQSLAEAKLRLDLIAGTLSADGSCRLLVQASDKLARQMTIETKLHYLQDGESKEETLISSYVFHHRTN